MLACVLLLAASTPACDRNDESSSSQLPFGTITGRERLGWNQRAPDAAELAQYSYLLYVDGTPNLLADAVCGALTGEIPTASCSSSLPPLKPGTHTLELGTRIARGDLVLESERSALLVVIVTGSGTASAVSQAALAPGSQRRADVPYVIESVVRGLDRPSSLASLPDGRIVIADSGARLWVAPGNIPPILPAAVLADAAADGDGKVRVAVDPDFAVTRHVFVTYSAHGAGGAPSVGRVVRVREVGGALGEPAVILDGLPAGAGSPSLRIGPDGALLVATAAASVAAADDFASYEGKVLRFAANGGTPADNPIRHSPVYAYGYRGRTEIAWDPAGQFWWHVQASETGVSVGRLLPGGKSRGAIELGRIQAVDAAFHSGATPAAWQGSLFIASPDQQSLYRVSGLSSTPQEPVVEQLLRGEFGRISAVCSAEDGLYFATANGAGPAGKPTDAVYRIRDRAERK